MTVDMKKLEEARDKAVVAVLNCVPQSREHEAEEMVEAIVTLVFETMRQYLNEEMEHEQSYEH